MSSFKDILAQDSAVSFLRSAINSERIANAYLFHGPSGVGKKMTAISFAKAINCICPHGGTVAKYNSRHSEGGQRPTEESKSEILPRFARQDDRRSLLRTLVPSLQNDVEFDISQQSHSDVNHGLPSGDSIDGCGSCSSCKKINSLNHPDVRLIEADNYGSSVKIEDVRAVIEDVGMKPYEAKKKVYIVDGADNLTEEAANALLKTLEEPSSESMLILISENSRRLLSTIRSRCQAVKFFPLGVNTVAKILTDRHGINGDTAHILAGLSCGSLGEALRLNEDDFFARRDRIIKALSTGTLAELEFDKTTRPELRTALNIMLMWYRDILVAKAGNSNVINIDKEALIYSEAKKTGFDRLNNTITRIISIQGYLEQNANPKLAMAALGSSI